jgi:hypothetical protein
MVPYHVIYHAIICSNEKRKILSRHIQYVFAVTSIEQGSIFIPILYIDTVITFSLANDT